MVAARELIRFLLRQGYHRARPGRFAPDSEAPHSKNPRDSGPRRRSSEGFISQDSEGRRIHARRIPPRLNVRPAALYHAPSGASGSDSRHSFSWYKSSAVNLALCYSVEEVLAQSRRQIRPLNLRHHSPKVIRASLLFKRSRSAGLLDSVSWVVNEKNRSFSASLDARPVSIKSTSTRLALVFSVFASAFTRFATRAGSETLCRTDFSVLAINSSYTTLHHHAPITPGTAAFGTNAAGFDLSPAISPALPRPPFPATSVSPS